MPRAAKKKATEPVEDSRKRKATKKSVLAEKNKENVEEAPEVPRAKRSKVVDTIEEVEEVQADSSADVIFGAYQKLAQKYNKLKEQKNAAAGPTAKEFQQMLRDAQEASTRVIETLTEENERLQGKSKNKDDGKAKELSVENKQLKMELMQCQKKVAALEKANSLLEEKVKQQPAASTPAEMAVYKVLTALDVKPADKADTFRCVSTHPPSGRKIEFDVSFDDQEVSFTPVQVDLKGKEVPEYIDNDVDLEHAVAPAFLGQVLLKVHDDDE